MIFPANKRKAAWLLWLLSAPLVQAADLSLTRAEQLALSQEPGLLALQLEARALDEEAVAAASWQDPKLSFGTMNLPGNKPDPANQGMLELKLEQMFPRGNSAEIQQQKKKLEGSARLALADERRLQLLRDVRISWFDTWYWQQAQQQLQHNRYLFVSLSHIAESMYRQGRRTQQDFLRAQLELSRLDERKVVTAASLQQSKAQLAQWLGQPVPEGLPERLPNRQPSPKPEQQQLLRHPLVKAADLGINQADQDIDLAKETYKPAWGVEVKYGRQQNDSMMGMDPASRDQYSAMVMLDLPLFTGNRQDRQLQASQYRQQARLGQREQLVRQLNSQLQQEYARYQGLAERMQLYKNRLLPQTQQQADAALRAYQADQGDFIEVMEAYITRLNLDIDYQRLQADLRQSQARLTYLLPSQDDLQRKGSGR